MEPSQHPQIAPGVLHVVVRDAGSVAVTVAVAVAVTGGLVVEVGSRHPNQPGVLQVVVEVDVSVGIVVVIVGAGVAVPVSVVVES